jgi:DNA-binding NarL/FixJ family response regulator
MWIRVRKFYKEKYPHGRDKYLHDTRKRMNNLTGNNSSNISIRLSMVNMPILLLELCKSAFEKVPDIDVMETVTDMQQSSECLRHDAIDVILLGSTQATSACNAIPLLGLLANRYKSAKVLVVMNVPAYIEVIYLFKAGVKGILDSSDLQFDCLCESIRSVHHGKLLASDHLLPHLVSYLSHPQSRDVADYRGQPLLTTREQQVLNLLADGMSNNELAAFLQLSEHTVKNHLVHIYDKLGVSNRTEAVLYALTPRTAPTVDESVMAGAPSQGIRMVKTASRSFRYGA